MCCIEIKSQGNLTSKAEFSLSVMGIRRIMIVCSYTESLTKWPEIYRELEGTSESSYSSCRYLWTEYWMMFPVMLAPTSMLPDVLIAQNSKIFLIWQTMRSTHKDISDFILRVFVYTCSISLREIEDRACVRSPWITKIQYTNSHW